MLVINPWYWAMVPNAGFAYWSYEDLTILAVRTGSGGEKSLLPFLPLQSLTRMKQKLKMRSWRWLLFPNRWPQPWVRCQPTMAVPLRVSLKVCRCSSSDVLLSLSLPSQCCCVLLGNIFFLKAGRLHLSCIWSLIIYCCTLHLFVDAALTSVVAFFDCIPELLKAADFSVCKPTQYLKFLL